TSIMSGLLESLHQVVDGRGHRVSHLLGQVRVKSRGRGGGMTENVLNDAQVDPGFKEMGGHTVAQRMDVGGFAHAALLQGAAKGPLQSAAGDRAAIGLHAVFESVPGDCGKQPEWGTMGWPKFP